MDSAAIQEAKQQENPYAKAQITTKIIPSTNNTFGYDILLYGKYDNGIWQYNGSTWSQLTPYTPEAMVATGSLLYGDFGFTGIWMYNGSTWTQITPNDPASMTGN
jgi:hypothetical protein